MSATVRRRRTKGLIPWVMEKAAATKTRLFRVPEMDLPLTALCLLASLLGVIAIFSAGMTGSTLMGIPRDALKQMMWLGVALTAFWLTAGCRGDGIKAWTNRILLVSVILTLLTFVPGLGRTENSQSLWLNLGPFSMQPAELLKYAALMAVALAFSQMSERPEFNPPYRSLPELFRHYIKPLFRHNIPLITGFACAILVLVQQDMATASVILVSMLGMFVVSGVENRQIWRLVGLMTVMALGFGLLAGYRMTRIQNWIHRWDPAIINHGGFQQTRSEWAIAEGGWTGKGLAQGRIKRSLPTPTSDFVMSTVGEELGVIGVWAFIAAMGGIALRMLQLAARAGSLGRLVCTGAGVWIAAQTAINICMVNATIPAVGLPMPFVTYGGSSLVVLWILVGAATSVSRREKEEKRVAADGDGWRNRRTRFSRA